MNKSDEVPDNLKLTEEEKQFLRDTPITDTTPGPLLHDFAAFLAILEERPVQLSKTYRLGLAELGDINEKLYTPIELDLKRPQQKSYPPIMGLYLLLRTSGLTQIDKTTKKPKLLLNNDVYEQWQTLNPVERYGYLLETWLLRGFDEAIGEDGWLGMPMGFRELIDAYRWRDAESRDIERFLSAHTLGLMMEFGFIEVEAGKPNPGEGWNVKQIGWTTFGSTMAKRLHAATIELMDALIMRPTYVNNDVETIGLFQPIFQPYFPEWKRLPEVNIEVEFREGVHQFKVSLGRVWRRLQINASYTLEDLAYAILGAFEFDSDHLYEFEYQTPLGMTESIVHPYMDEPPFAPEVRVGDLGLDEGASMLFRFDFGANWEFDVLLESVDPDNDQKSIQVTDSRGDPPEQYPGW